MRYVPERKQTRHEFGRVGKGKVAQGFQVVELSRVEQTICWKVQRVAGRARERQ